MARRYYQSVRSRMNEGEGMAREIERAHDKEEKMEDRHRGDKRMIGEEYYASYDMSRRQQLEDSRMISEDHRAIANLPQEVIMRPYAYPEYAQYDLDDTIYGIDLQQNKDVSGARKHRSRKKY